MAEAQQITFSYKELVELMLRDQGIHEGLWAIYLKFGIAGLNVGEDPNSLHPAAMVPVLEIGLQRTEERTNLAVDAAELTKSHAPKKAGPA